MARHKQMQPQEEDEPTLDISSLIDVCFLLLIYFLVTTTITKKEQDLDMTLPVSQPSDTPPEVKPILIKIDSNNFVYYSTEGGVEELVEQDPESRELPNLSARLNLSVSAASSGAGDQKPVVQVFVDGESKQKRVIDVLNSIAGAGINTVTFTDLIDPEN